MRNTEARSTTPKSSRRYGGTFRAVIRSEKAPHASANPPRNEISIKSREACREAMNERKE